MISGLVLSLIFAVGACAAGVVPTAPGPGQSFKEGGDCTLSWNLDTSGKWTSFSVDLMSGSNTAMQSVTNVFKDRDGTKGETSLTWKCPAVTPNSAIYFYQFTQAGADTTWTTRFTITSPTGEVTPPANSLQPGGAQIPWGIGHLAAAGAGSTVAANTSTTVPSSSANITALNTPVTNATTLMNTTTATPATNMPTTTTANPGKTPAAPTQSTSTTTDSSSNATPSTVPTRNTTADKTTSTSGANVLTPGKTSVAALTLAAAVAFAC